MHWVKLIWFAVAGLMLMPGAVMAENVLKPGFKACVAGARNAEALTTCITDAQASCQQYEWGDPAVGSCFKSARAEWGIAMGEFLAQFSQAGDRVVETIQIEAKYAVLKHMMSCDRQLELRAVGREPDARDEEIRIACQATASASALAEVMIRSGSIAPQ